MELSIGDNMGLREGGNSGSWVVEREREDG